MIFIFKGTKKIGRSRNLRGMLAYASKHKVDEITIRELATNFLNPLDPTANVHVVFADGAECRFDFASFNLAKDFFIRRLSTGNWKPRSTGPTMLRVRTLGTERIQYMAQHDAFIHDHK